MHEPHKPQFTEKLLIRVENTWLQEFKVKEKLVTAM